MRPEDARRPPRYAAGPVRRLCLPLIAALALACQPPPKRADAGGEGQSSAGADANPKAEPANAAKTCSAEAIEPELLALCDFDLGIPPLALPKVEWSAPTYHPEATRVISIDRRGLNDPEGGDATVSVANWLANPPRRLPEPGVMVFAVAADVPATTIAELQAGLAAAGRKEVRYLVEIASDTPIPQPRKPEMLTEMRAKLPGDANQKIVFIAQGVRGYAETCPAFAGAFNELSKTAAADRCATLAKGASQAIASCSCEKGDEIMTLLYALTVGLEPPKGRVTAVPVMLDESAAPTAVKAEDTWGALASQTFTDTELHRLWLVPAPASGGE